MTTNTRRPIPDHIAKEIRQLLILRKGRSEIALMMRINPEMVDRVIAQAKEKKSPKNT